MATAKIKSEIFAAKVKGLLKKQKLTSEQAAEKWFGDRSKAALIRHWATRGCSRATKKTELHLKILAIQILTKDQDPCSASYSYYIRNWSQELWRDADQEYQQGVKQHESNVEYRKHTDAVVNKFLSDLQQLEPSQRSYVVNEIKRRDRRVAEERKRIEKLRETVRKVSSVKPAPIQAKQKEDDFDSFDHHFV